jgi:hypothetical protein
VSAKKLTCPIWNVRFHPDGFLIGGAGGNDGGHVLFWKPGEANEFFDFKLPGVCHDLDLHPDALRLATSHDDNVLRLWRMTAKG